MKLKLAVDFLEGKYFMSQRLNRTVAVGIFVSPPLTYISVFLFHLFVFPIYRLKKMKGKEKA